MALLVGGRRREVLLGERASLEGEVPVVDWRSAPIAEVFFTCDPGDDYEIEAEGRVLEGRLLEKEFLDGASTRATGILIARKDRDDSRFGEVAFSMLDEEQRVAVEGDTSVPMLITGAAGYGKTTVALHRLVRHAKLVSKEGGALSAIVIVPTVGLSRLCRRLLDRMGHDEVQVATFDEWIGAQARAVFRSLPTRNSVGATAAVIRLKRHPAVLSVLPRLERRRHATRAHLEELFGDRRLLAEIVEASAGELRVGSVDEVIAHTRVQFSLTAEEEYSHVDPEHLRTIDGLAIDARTPNEDAASMDVEDFPVLFAINRLLCGKDATSRGRLATYDHVVVDEAQELAPMDLAVVGRAVARGGALTIAGDERQQMDETAFFTSFADTMRHLGRPRHVRIELETSHRCPPSVERFSQRILGVPDPDRDAALEAEDSSLAAKVFSTELHLAYALEMEVGDLMARDNRAAVAVICRSRDAATRVFRMWFKNLAPRLALDGDFDFDGGLMITCAEEVKGLEFSHVVIPDADVRTYPDTAESRRALYLASTRATEQLWVLCVGRWSPIVMRAVTR